MLLNVCKVPPHKEEEEKLPGPSDGLEREETERERMGCSPVSHNERPEP